MQRRSCWCIDICSGRGICHHCPSPHLFCRPLLSFLQRLWILRVSPPPPAEGSLSPLWACGHCPVLGCGNSAHQCGIGADVAQASPQKAAWHAVCLLRLAARCFVANQHVLEHRQHSLEWNWPPNVPFWKKSEGQIKVNLMTEVARLEALFSLAPGSRWPLAWQRPAGRLPKEKGKTSFGHPWQPAPTATSPLSAAPLG